MIELNKLKIRSNNLLLRKAGGTIDHLAAISEELLIKMEENKIREKTKYV